MRAHTTLTVAENLPLTHDDFGMRVHVVVDADGVPAGVYPTPERALAYIADWLSQTEMRISHTQPVSNDIHVFACSVDNDFEQGQPPMYRIVPDTFRM